MRIGIMGGTFDPIHNAHIMIAYTAYQAMDLASVVFMPTGNPPHKTDLAQANDRYNMVSLAVEGLPWAQTSRLETDRQGKIYTVDTLSILREQHPKDRFYWIVGADALRDMPLWHDAQRAMTLCELVAIARPGIDPASFEQAKRAAIETAGATVHLLQVEVPDISSTMIRHLCEKHLPIDHLVPAKVAEYIGKKGLYR